MASAIKGMKALQKPPVVLFGYDSSAFTQKIRLALTLKQIPFTYAVVSSMMPRPHLVDLFHLTYRKIPVTALGSEVYSDTSITLEALETTFQSEEHPTLYPPDASGRSNRSLIRGFGSYWIDRPFFRVTAGLIPGDVWRTSFGADRGPLIGHKIDADKLEKKIPQNLSLMDMQLSILEPQLREAFNSSCPWILATATPSLADLTLYYQLSWINDIAKGRGIHDLTGGELPDTDTQGMSQVFNEHRYPALWKWMHAFRAYISELPSMELGRTTDSAEIARILADAPAPSPEPPMVPTPAGPLTELDAQNGWAQGAPVMVVPDDTGKGDPTYGSLVALSPEEIVIKPKHIEGKSKPMVDARLHFPRIGFLIKPQRGE